MQCCAPMPASSLVLPVCSTSVSPQKIWRSQSSVSSQEGRRHCLAHATCSRPSGRRRHVHLRAHRVEIETPQGVEVISVEAGETILQTALDSGIELPHDCKMGVCMTCPARLVSGQVDQSAGMLDDTAKEKGYALMCVSEPLTDCRIRVIDEDEILEEVLCSSENAA